MMGSNFQNGLLQSRFFLQSEDSYNQRAIIKVIGVGGGGSNAVDHMISESIDGVEFYVANTDAQALAELRNPHRIQIGRELTKGLGAGSDPNVGREAALEDKSTIVDHLVDADMVFITAGLGGGTGTGAAPVIAAAVKEANPKTVVVAVVTTPFIFEGKRRMSCAKSGLVDLRVAVDSLITIPNQKLLSKTTTMKDAYGEANDVLLNAVKGIADLVVRPGYMNVDFADVRTVMSEAGQAVMGTGRASGENRAEKAARNAIENPLLDDIDVANAKGILVNVTSNEEMTPQEFSTIGEVINDVASEDAVIIPGQVYDESAGDELRVTIVATGLGEDEEIRPQPASPAEPAVAHQPDPFMGSEVGETIRPHEGDHMPAVLRNRGGTGFHSSYEFGNGNGLAQKD